MKIVIIGGGNMGRTYAESFLSAHIIRPNDLIMVQRNKQKANELSQKNLGTVITQPNQTLSQAELIILAVKPQDAEQLYPSIQPFINNSKVVLSIMAGVKMQAIANGLGVSKIIRAMPNLPAQVGMGMTAFTATEQVQRNELISVQNLLSTTGRAIYFNNEQMIDAATAVSGSGPAYVFYFMQAMVEAAIELNFSESEAELLVWQTFMGTMHLHNKNNLSCNEWIQKVASKGGTTEAAIKVFENNKTNLTIKNAVKQAFLRAQELGK